MEGSLQEGVRCQLFGDAAGHAARVLTTDNGLLTLHVLHTKQIANAAGTQADAEREAAAAWRRQRPTALQHEPDDVRAGRDVAELPVADGVGQNAGVAGVELAVSIDVHVDAPAAEARFG